MEEKLEKFLTPFVRFRDVKIYCTRHVYIVVAHLTTREGLQNEVKNMCW